MTDWFGRTCMPLVKRYEKFINFTARGNEEGVASIMCRLVLHELIPESVEKVLFIDTDAIAVGDLSRCFHTEVGFP